MKLRKYILASVILSLLLHLFLLFWLQDVSLSSQYPIAPLEEEEDQLVDISVALNPPKPPDPSKAPNPKDKGRAPKGSKGSDRLRKELDAFSDTAVKEIFKKELLAPAPPKVQYRFTGIEKAQIRQELPTPPAERAATAPRPEIVEINLADVAPKRIGHRRLNQKVERMDVPELKLASLLPHGPLSDAVGRTNDLGIKFSMPRLGAPSFPDGDDGDNPAGTKPYVRRNIADLPLPETIELTTPKLPEPPVKPFDDFVDVEVIVRDDPTTGGGFFQATIRANEKCDAVREIPKDVLFIIDRSTSISPKKFRAFKNASIEALEYLNRRDCFNIVTFTDQTLPYSRDYLPATQENRKGAAEFLNRLSRGGTTSLFDALNPYVSDSKSRNGRPLNLFLLTDGISTVNIFTNDELLRRIYVTNPGHVSIFPFCAGDDANRPLLDFLGFLNRGSSLHAETLEEVTEKLSSFITNHSSLLIKDIEYTAKASVYETIYPKKLQHLYRGSAVIILGKYSAEDSEIVLKVIGRDAENVRRDIIVRRNIEQCPHTEENLAHKWAARKIFQLLADRTLTVSPEVKKQLDSQIRALGAVYDIAIPY